ncbi:unnamed protein product, partial [Candidula unifasciata]
FGLLESGSVSAKNEVNIMAKNVADVIFGGISYWMLGYGFSFGEGPYTNSFCGIGKFFIDPDDSVMGEEFSRFVFQSSFATTATTIVSGAVAERMKYLAYIIFSFFNTFVFCFPAHWVWSKHGWLNKMGVVDVAGDGPVHLVGGATALITALMIKPRAKRFTPEDDHHMGSPTGALLGLFILWWGWLAFNCGSTYGISGGKWKIASRAAATTLMASSAGGVVGFAYSYIVNKKRFHIPQIINGVLAGLVSITATCAVTGVKESLVIGFVGGVLVMLSDSLLVKLHIDDPVSAVPVHGVGGVWGLLAAGLFTHKDTITQHFASRHGLIKGGDIYLLGVQALAVVSITAWTIVSSGIILQILDMTMGLRMTAEEEEIGADFVEHNIQQFLTALPQKCDHILVTSLHTRYNSDMMAAAISKYIGDNPAFNDTDDPVTQQTSTTAGSNTLFENSASNGRPVQSVSDGHQVKHRNKWKNRVRFSSIRIRASHHSTKGPMPNMSLGGLSKKDFLQRRFSDILSYSSRDTMASTHSDSGF